MGLFGLVGLLIASDVIEKIDDKIEERKERKKRKYLKYHIMDDDDDEDYDDEDDEEEDDEEEKEHKNSKQDEKLRLVRDSVPKIPVYDMPENLKCPLCGATREKKIVNGKLTCRFCDHEQWLKVIRYEDDNAGIKKAIDDYEREEAEKKRQNDHENTVSSVRDFGWIFILLMGLMCTIFPFYLGNSPGIIFSVFFTFAVVVVIFVFALYPASRKFIKNVALAPVLIGEHLSETFSGDRKLGTAIGWFIIIAFWIAAVFVMIMLISNA